MLMELLVLMEEQKNSKADQGIPFENVIAQCHSSCVEPVTVPLLPEITAWAVATW